jgi:hypothetical protein
MIKEHKHYTADVTLTFSGNDNKAESEEEFLEWLRDSFYEEYGIKDIEDDEIEIEEDTCDCKE